MTRLAATLSDWSYLLACLVSLLAAGALLWQAAAWLARGDYGLAATAGLLSVLPALLVRELCRALEMGEITP